jgi:hypothetical protein
VVELVRSPTDTCSDRRYTWWTRAALQRWVSVRCGREASHARVCTQLAREAAHVHWEGKGLRFCPTGAATAAATTTATDDSVAASYHVNTHRRGGHRQTKRPDDVRDD